MLRILRPLTACKNAPKPNFSKFAPTIVIRGSSKSADCKRGRRTGATSKNVKNRQKVSKSFSSLFDSFRAGQKTSKIVKKCQKVFRHFSTIFARHLFSGPFCNSPSKGDLNLSKICPKLKNDSFRTNFSIFGLIFDKFGSPDWNPEYQGKTKGQQLKGKIVSEFFTIFRTFSHFFRTFPPGLSPSKQRVLAP